MTIEVVSPPGLFIVLTITKRAHYKAKVRVRVRVRVRYKCKRSDRL